MSIDEDSLSEISNMTPRGLLQQITNNPIRSKNLPILEKIEETFMTAFRSRNTENDCQSRILKFLIERVLHEDCAHLERLDTIDLRVVDPLTRSNIRSTNRCDPQIIRKFKNSIFDIVKFTFSVLENYPHSTGIELEEIIMVLQVMRLLRVTLEYGFWEESNIRKLMHQFFKRTEELHKLEVYLSKAQKSYPEAVHENLALCKQEAASILLHISIIIDDAWLRPAVSTCEVSKLTDKLSKIQSIIRDDKEVKSLEELGRLVTDSTTTEKALIPFVTDTGAYKEFTFVVFNYLFYIVEEKGQQREILPRLKTCLEALLQYVSDIEKDPLSQSCYLLKKEYLPYYIGKVKLGGEVIEKANDIASNIFKVTEALKRLVEEGEVNILDKSNIMVRVKYRKGTVYNQRPQHSECSGNSSSINGSGSRSRSQSPNGSSFSINSEISRGSKTRDNINSHKNTKTHPQDPDVPPINLSSQFLAPKKKLDSKKMSQRKTVNLEKQVTTAFGEIETLLGINEETFDMRLLLTQKRIPCLLLSLLNQVQSTFPSNIGEQLLIDGLKILLKLSHSNFPAISQLTRGSYLEDFFSLVRGQHSAFFVLFIVQIFQEEPLFLHINHRVTFLLLDFVHLQFSDFFDSFMNRDSASSKKLVELFIYLRLLQVIMDLKNTVSVRLRREFHFQVSDTLHTTVTKFVVPLLKTDKLKVTEYYEPKLVKKKWNFENWFSLANLMLLDKEHKRSILVDVCLEVLKTYNLAGEGGFKKQVQLEVKASLPKSLKCFDYLTSFPEGILIKAEVLKLYCHFKVFPRVGRLSGNYSERELSQESQDTFLEYMPRDHIRAVPTTILEEMNHFCDLNLENYDQEDLLEYLMNGVFRILYKYSKGILWFGNGCDDDEVISQLSSSLQKLNTGLYNIKQMIPSLKEALQRRRGDRAAPRGPREHISLLANQILGGTVRPILTSLEKAYENSKYSYIKNEYGIRKEFIDVDNMPMVKSLLSTEISYQQSVNYGGAWSFQGGSAHSSPLSASKSRKDVVHIVSQYYQCLKTVILRKPQLNVFYSALVSKMRDINLRNLVMYWMNHLKTLEYDYCSSQSLWMNNEALDFIIFMSNTVAWCSKTRKALFIMFKRNKEVGILILSLVYKVMRDSFSVVAYTPFYNRSYQLTWSRFYACSSFLQAICRENFQEFKLYLGQLQPDLDCEVFAGQQYFDFSTAQDTQKEGESEFRDGHPKTSVGSTSRSRGWQKGQEILIDEGNSKKGPSMVRDLQAILLKFLWFSGLSRNKSSKVLISDRLLTVPTIVRVMKCLTSMITGPCPQNQRLLYQGGTQIWHNLLSRCIQNLDSQYYYLLSVSLEYLNALLEGSQPIVLNFFSAAFDIPLMYDMIVVLVIQLHKNRNSLGRTSNHHLQGEIGGPDDPSKNDQNTFSFTASSTTNSQIAPKTLISDRRSSKMQRNTLKKFDASILLNLQFKHSTFSRGSRSKAPVFLDINDPSIDPDSDQISLKNSSNPHHPNYTSLNKKSSMRWEELIDSYRLNRFEDHLVLQCAVSIYQFLNRVSQHSKKYQIFFDTKDQELEIKYLEAGYTIDEVHTGKARLVGPAKCSSSLIVHYFLGNITSKIELLDENRIPQILIFPKPPCCFYLTPKTTSHFEKTFNIDNTESKMLDIFSNFDGFYREMKSYEVIISEYPFIALLLSSKTFLYAKSICWSICLIINILHLKLITYQDFKAHMDNKYLELLSIILSGIVIGFSVIMTLIWLTTTYPIKLINEFQKYKKRYPFSSPYSISAIMRVGVFRCLLRQSEVMSFLLHILFCLLGLFSDKYWQSFNLILIVNISNTSRYVLQSITIHYDQLIATLGLASIIVFCFANFNGQFYSAYFDSSISNSERPCDSLQSCFFSTMDLGFRLGGGIGEALVYTSINDEKINFFKKIFFNISFFLLVNVISLNIIFGIIIDTFAELRSEQNERDWDSVNRCDVCGIERRFFEKNGLNFNIHKLLQHNIWDYVFYLVYLHTIQDDSLSGVEFYVLAQFRSNNTAWLPIKRTIYINLEEDENRMILKKINEKLQKLEKVGDIPKQIDDSFKRFDKRLERLEELVQSMVIGGDLRSDEGIQFIWVINGN